MNENLKNGEALVDRSRMPVTSVEHKKNETARAQVYALLALAEEFKRFNDFLVDQSKLGGVLRRP